MHHSRTHFWIKLTSMLPPFLLPLFALLSYKHIQEHNFSFWVKGRSRILEPKRWKIEGGQAEGLIAMWVDCKSVQFCFEERPQCLRPSNCLFLHLKTIMCKSWKWWKYKFIYSETVVMYSFHFTIAKKKEVISAWLVSSTLKK